MKKLLSIIIPTYNMEVLLGRCLTSLILDTKEKREKLDVIVVIDGATDNSSQIAHRYEGQYPEMFRVVDKKNGNYGSCINAALPLIEGKYVRILDADDSFHTENIEEYLLLLSLTNVELVLSDYDIVNECGAITELVSFKFDNKIELQIEAIDPSLYFAMHSVAYRSDIFCNIEYHQTERVSYTDVEWVFYPMTQVQYIRYFNKSIYRYLLGRDGQTVNDETMLMKLNDRVKGIWGMLELVQTLPPNNLVYPRLYNIVDVRLRFLYVSAMKKKAVIDLKSFDNRLRKFYPVFYEHAISYTIPITFFNMQMPVVLMWRTFQSKLGFFLFPKYYLYILAKVINKLL